jgi:hypothetical protein
MSVTNIKDLGKDLSTLPPYLQVFFLSKGAAISTALSLIAELGVADLLTEGPKTSEDLAQATSTHPGALDRVLHLLSSVGVFTEVSPGCFGLNPLADCLRTGVPGSMRSWVRMTGFKVWYQVYPEALYSLRTGQPVLKKTVGADFFDYLAAHPDEDVLFNEAMTNFGQENSPAVIEAYDFSGIHKIVDVGGSHGSLLLAILQVHPEMTGVLFDLPHVAESARQKIAEAGFAQRCEIVKGDFFVSLPAGGDAYLLRWIIHDWDDERAVKILRNCRSAMNKTARLLLVEAIIPHEDALHPGKIIDFDMLVALGGKERTEEEYSALFDASGFRLNRIIPTASPMCIIEGMPK